MIFNPVRSKNSKRKEDWRGTLALMIWVGFFVMLGIPLIMRDLEAVKIVAAVLGMPIAMITTWYYGEKRNES
jgi:predicted permease